MAITPLVLGCSALLLYICRGGIFYVECGDIQHMAFSNLGILFSPNIWLPAEYSN